MASSMEITPHSVIRLPQYPAGPTVALIPAYNEEPSIGRVVRTTRSHVDYVVVVDDGSRDRTADVARRAGAIVVQHHANRGKAAAVNTGFAQVRRMGAGAMVMLDGDGQHCTDDIPTVLAPIIADDADVVIGSRFLGVTSDIPVYRKIGQHILTYATNMASGVHVSDSQSGFRAFSSQALEVLSFGQGGFSVESEMQFRIREHALRLAEVPIKVTYAEKAKRNPATQGMQVINGVTRLVSLTRPLLFFGLNSLVIAAISILVALRSIQIHAQTGHLALGYGLMAVLLCVVGTLFLFVGVTLHATRAMVCDFQRSLLERLGKPDHGAVDAAHTFVKPLPAPAVLEIRAEVPEQPVGTEDVPKPRTIGVSAQPRAQAGPMLCFWPFSIQLREAEEPPLL